MKYKHIGVLSYNSLGRLSVSDGYYWTCGDTIELKIKRRYVKGRIEHSSKYNGYYFLNEGLGIYIGNLEGMKARI